MIPYTHVQKRILDEVNRYAPTLEEVQLNERATAACQASARQDPTGIEASGLDDLLAVRRTFQQLYWRNTRCGRGRPAPLSEASIELAVWQHIKRAGAAGVGVRQVAAETGLSCGEIPWLHDAGRCLLLYSISTSEASYPTRLCDRALLMTAL